MKDSDYNFFTWEPPDGDSIKGIVRVRDHWIVVTELWVYRLTERDPRNPRGYVVERLMHH